MGPFDSMAIFADINRFATIISAGKIPAVVGAVGCVPVECGHIHAAIAHVFVFLGIADWFMRDIAAEKERIGAHYGFVRETWNLG